MGLIDYKLRVRELYESLGPRYVDLYIRESALAYLGFLEDFQPRGSSVLDVGCGVGAGAGLISGIAGRFVCLDVACSVLRFPKSLPWVDVVCADGALPPIRPGSVDYALLINVVNAEGDGADVLRGVLGLGAVVFAVSPRDVDNELIRAMTH
jgi:SAM-dependent methyltransferase